MLALDLAQQSEQLDLNTNQLETRLLSLRLAPVFASKIIVLAGCLRFLSQEWAVVDMTGGEYISLACLVEQVAEVTCHVEKLGWAFNGVVRPRGAVRWHAYLGDRRPESSMSLVSRHYLWMSLDS